MSDQRINLAALRAREVHPDDWLWITPEELLALVEAVEAAHRVATERHREAVSDLDVAVARFDFGELP